MALSVKCFLCDCGDPSSHPKNLCKGRCSAHLQTQCCDEMGGEGQVKPQKLVSCLVWHTVNYKEEY